MSKKIVIAGTNILKVQNTNAISNRMDYVCANSEITTGVKEAPSSLDECYELWPEIKEIASLITVGNTYTFTAYFGISGASGNTSGIKICGLSGASGFPIGTTGGLTLIFAEPLNEAKLVETILGRDWLGCFWPDPLAAFSADCPRYGPMFETYLRYRLGSATFWDTPTEVPVLRQQFVESIKDLVEITVSGDFSQRPGDIVYIKADNATGLVTENLDLNPESIKSGYYYIVRVKNTIKNDFAHTTIISLSKFTRGKFYPPYMADRPYGSV